MFSKKTPIFLFSNSLPQLLKVSHIQVFNLVLISYGDKKALELGIPQKILAQTIYLRQVGFWKYFLNYKHYTQLADKAKHDPFFFNMFFAIQEGGVKL